MRVATFLKTVPLLLVAGGLLAAVPKLPPRTLPANDAEWDKALAPFVARAREEFPQALERFRQSVGSDRQHSLILVTRRTNAAGEPEQIGLNAKEVTPEGIIQGDVINSEVEGISRGDSLGIVASEVYDWGLRPPGRPGEGFFVRRARNAITTGMAIVYFQLQADQKGRLIHCELAEALLPLTREDVTDLLPTAVEEDGLAYLSAFYARERVPERFIQVSLVYSFPEGKRVEDTQEGS